MKIEKKVVEPTTEKVSIAISSLPGVYSIQNKLWKRGDY